MMFSKSFGYALRGVLYIGLLQNDNRNIQVDEIASQLQVPRHFMGKILKRLVKENLLISMKGPSGGFKLHENTLGISLLSIYELTEGLSTFKNCVLRLKDCNAQNPCPLHYKAEEIKKNLMTMLEATTVADLLQSDKTAFINSIANNDIPNSENLQVSFTVSHPTEQNE